MRAIAHLCAGVSGALIAALISANAYAETQIVRFLHNETDPPSIAFFNEAIKQFEAENPDIKIEMEAVSTDGRLQKILASINAKTMPEIVKILPEERFQFAKAGYLEPLDDLIDEIGRADYLPESLVAVDGVHYDLPYTVGNFSVLWERDDLLKAKGLHTATNWDELEANAKALTADGVYGFVFPAGKNRMTSIFMSMMMWNAGGTYFDKDFHLTFDNPGTIKALTFLKTMAQYSPPGIGSYSYSDMMNGYLAGKVAQDIYAPRLAANAAANTPEIFKNTSAHTVPVGPSGVGVKFVNANSFALSSAKVGAKNTAAARKFLKFVTTGERSVAFSLTAFPHLIPPLRSLQQEVITKGASLLGGREEVARIGFDTSNSLDFDTEAGATFVDGKVVRTGEVNRLIGPIVARNIPAEVLQRVVLQGEDPAAAAAWGQEQMQEVIDDLN